MTFHEPHGQDPEAEQEVDFGRYWRLIGARWWVVAAGLVLGAIVGYAVSLGGGQTYQATATLYLGQPYSASGNIGLQTLQTNPSTVKTIIHSEAVIEAAATSCKTKPSSFRGGISTQQISGNLAKNGQTPLVSVTVKSAKRKVVACTANALSQAVIRRIAGYANLKIAHFEAQMSADKQRITTIQAGITSATMSTVDRLLIQLQLGNLQGDYSGASQLLLQAEQVEAPKLLTPAAAQVVTARSRRNSVVVAALIGLILGVLAALMWDGVAAGFSRRRPA